ncbi:MAG: DMT family transporter [Shewanella sp.]|nr:DMT family transporter [Shewanella sp.]MCF1431155.1 DMT family transporter [Shewanella sp.]MCF1437736.1 DMT family transporter [Shewanella sp.]MCF1459629.1 DMT family transporter [Shewanella sp.]
MKTSNLAYAYGLGAVLCWSTVATAFKLALQHFTPLQLVLVAVCTSIITLAVILGVQGKLKLLKGQFKSRPLFYLQTGIINPFLYYMVLFESYALLPAQQALALNYTWAILLPLLAVPLLGQKLKGSDILAAITGYMGVLVIATGGNPLSMQFENPLGVAMALVSTGLWSLYWIINTKDKGEPVVSLLLSFMVSLPFILGMVLATDTLPTLSLQALTAGVYVGLFEMGITFVLWLMALKKAERAANISTLAFLTPLLSMCLIALVLKETITASTIAGMGLILSALVMQKLLQPRSPKVEAA